MTRARLPSHGLAHVALAICGGLLLVAVGQPIATDDLWWHLALGRAFARQGPWVTADPLLFAPAGPPSTASWLADVALERIAHAAGFHALRALHVATVAAILALAWSELRRASGSRALASLGTLAFGALAAYRLLQLRPELFSIAATLLCYRWSIAAESPPSARQIAAIGALCALWVNLHAGFPLGPMVIAVAIAGLVCAAPLRSAARGDRARPLRLTIALGVAGLATLANPAGVGAHLAYLVAGGTTPSLERVRDEWGPLALFALPAPPGPSAFSWALAWALLLGLGWILARWISRAPARRDLDPAKLAVSLLSVGLMLAAVRFLWLGIFPMLLFASAYGSRAGAPRSRAANAFRGMAWIGAAACVIAAGFVKLGDRLIMRDAMLNSYYYQRPYPPSKHHAAAIWLLADSGVRGNLYHEYFMGGFAGYWLAPEVRSLVNGTLNFPSEFLDALGAIGRRGGLRTGEDFAALLDRLDLDLFLGIRMPEAAVAPASWSPTTAHLENTPGWIPIYRNLASAIYLRANDRNRTNLERLARHYAASGVPFDVERGFDVEAVIRDAPDWAVSTGLVPIGFVGMARDTLSRHASAGVRDRVAAIWAVLGRYERAIAIDRPLLRAQPEWVNVRRRLAWSLLRLGHLEEAAAVARELASRPATDELSHWIAETARDARDLAPEETRAAIAVLPFLTPAESAALQASQATLEPRPPR